MRVLFISHQANRSGAPLALFQEVDYLLRQYGIKPVVLLLADGEIKQDFDKLCQTVNWNSLMIRILRKCRLDKVLLKYFPFDCIYANSIVSIDVALTLKRRLGIPLIVHTHESESYLKEYIKSADRLNEVDCFITVSEFSKRCLVQTFGIQNSNIFIQRPFSPWVIKAIEGKADISPIKRTNNEFVIGTVCNGTWQKAPELIAITANLFFQKHPDANCKFMVAGIDRDSDAYYHIVYDLERMGIMNKVILIGRVGRPLDYYPLFDVFMLHSREDSFPLVAEEAAISGLPIVSFENANGAAEWIKNSCGILVPYLDLDALVDALFMLYNKEDLRKQLGNEAKRMIKKMYEEESQIKNVIKVLQTVESSLQ